MTSEWISPSFSPSEDQQRVYLHTPTDKIFLEGEAGRGKTTAAIYLMEKIIRQGIAPEKLLILVPQQSLGQPYLRAIHHPAFIASSPPPVLTIGGLARWAVGLFWQEIAEAAGFGTPRNSPIFLNIETSQYIFSQIASAIHDEVFFDEIKLDRNRLYIQILDNLNKAAVVGFSAHDFGSKLQSAWNGDSSQMAIYEKTQEIADRFRCHCLENNLLDFSLLLETFCKHVWGNNEKRAYLMKCYDYLIYDNIEEDVPLTHDIVKEWMPHLQGGILLFDLQGGYRVFLGADPQNALSLQSECEHVLHFENSLVTPSGLIKFSERLTKAIMKEEMPKNPGAFRSEVAVASYRLFPEMVEEVGQSIRHLIDEEHVPPGEIAVLAPYLSDSLKFSLSYYLENFSIPYQTLRPARPLGEESITRSLLTLARLAHPQWGQKPEPQAVRELFIHSIEGMDPVRAELMARILYQPGRFSPAPVASDQKYPLMPFDALNAEKQSRITYQFAEKYEILRAWLINYQALEPTALDYFLRLCFEEILSRPGFGFHQNIEAAAQMEILIEAVSIFRKFYSNISLHQETHAVDLQKMGAESALLIEQGLISGTRLLSQEFSKQAVLISPAYTFLMLNRAVRFQYWLDINSSGWWERPFQPLTHPHVLSRRWVEGQKWRDADETEANRIAMAHLTKGLVNRCREKIFLISVLYSEQGLEQKGMLIKSLGRTLS